MDEQVTLNAVSAQLLVEPADPKQVQVARVCAVSRRTLMSVGAGVAHQRLEVFRIALVKGGGIVGDGHALVHLARLLGRKLGEELTEDLVSQLVRKDLFEGAVFYR